MWSFDRRAAIACAFIGAVVVVLVASPGKVSLVSAQVPLATPTVLPSVAPEPSDASAIPTVPPTPTAAPRHGRHKGGPTAAATDTPSPGPTATPTSPAFSTLDGTWEVQVQSIAGTA